MTYEEWKEKKAAEKAITEYLEKTRQKQFAEQQSRESVFTKPSDRAEN
jgi:hypothetical protein